MNDDAAKCSQCGRKLDAEADGEVQAGMCQSCMWDEECEMMEGEEE